MVKKAAKYGIEKEQAKTGIFFFYSILNTYLFNCSLLVNVLHSIFNVADVPLKTVHFLQAGFDRNGERLLAVDQRGNVYVFDLIRNK
jgi:hypothetical protein